MLSGNSQGTRVQAYCGSLTGHCLLKYCNTKNVNYIADEVTIMGLYT